MGDQHYYAYGKVRGYSGSFPTRYPFTGQYIDGSGLIYMNARYYDRQTGQFISPDTLTPDPGLLMGYNRYGYARGNPMRFTDPSAFYSNDEIMQHFDCNDWSCVEAMFGDDGAHAGLWGWLYFITPGGNANPAVASRKTND